MDGSCAGLLPHFYHRGRKKKKFLTCINPKTRRDLLFSSSQPRTQSWTIVLVNYSSSKMLEMVLSFNSKCGRKTLPAAVVNVFFLLNLWKSISVAFPLNPLRRVFYTASFLRLFCMKIDLPNNITYWRKIMFEIFLPVFNPLFIIFLIRLIARGMRKLLQDKLIPKILNDTRKGGLTVYN